MPQATFKVFLYEEELRYLEWLVRQKPNIETGGDLFGLWQTKEVVVIHLVLGPGRSCSRTPTSFHQDVDYLKDVGEKLTQQHGLCNVGEWHSHHTLGLAEPSAGDRSTVWQHIDTIGERFLVFIANNRVGRFYQNAVVNVGCFLFNNATKKVENGCIKKLPGMSPLREVLHLEIAKNAEHEQDWRSYAINTEEHKQRRNSQQRKRLLSSSQASEMGECASWQADQESCVEDEEDMLLPRKDNKESCCATCWTGVKKKIISLWVSVCTFFRNYCC